MKKLLILTLLLLSAAFAFAQQKPRIAVYMTGNDPVNEIISNRLMMGFSSSGKYIPVERSATFLAEINKEQSYQRSGEVDDDQIAAIGKQFGLQYVCVVSVLNVWKNEKYITAHIIDVNSAEVIGSCSSNGTLSSPTALMNSLDDLSKKITSALDYSKQDETDKVAVYVTKTGNKDVDIILGDQLVAGFAKSGNYIAIERTSSFLKQLSKEVGYQQSGAVDDDERIAELGKRFGVKYVCVAKTIPWGGSYFVSTRLIDVETVEILKMYNAENKVMENINDVMKVTLEIVNNLIGNFSGGSTITINVGSVSFDMIKVEAGTFDMGCTSDQNGECVWYENPNHQVTISNDYYIGKFEVTQELYQTVMDTNPSRWKGTTLPVENVSWNDAMEFCSELSRITGRRFTLPTEAEWEYAARGGKKATPTKYSGSNSIDTVAWYDRNSDNQPHPVGRLRANELGIYDMTGNVMEWCLDWFGNYSSESQTDPMGPSSGSSRVLRGGCWHNSAKYCRVANRGSHKPPSCRHDVDRPNVSFGFRVVLH